MNCNLFGLLFVMVTIGTKTIRIVNEAMNYVIENLNDQLVIPSYDSSWASGGHELFEGITSELIFQITIKNTAITNDIRDLGSAMADVAELLVDDYLESDCDITMGFDSTCNHITRRYFKVDYTYSVSRTTKINGETFEITVTFERKYTKRE